MKLGGSVNRIRGIKRFGTIARVMVKHGLGDLFDWLVKSGRPDISAPDAAQAPLKSGFPSPGRIRLILEELGPSFIKLGQLMSTRADIFPPEYIAEFKKLQDRVAPVAYDGMRTVIESELGATVPEIFSWLETDAAAAASVAQVHVGMLHSGEKVAVKVIRPGIHKRIRQDLRLMFYFAEKLEKAFEVGRLIGFVNLVKEFERTIFKELDMHIEGGQMERFASYFKDSEEIYIPRVFWSYTAKSVLVMEHIDGIKMDDVDKIRAAGIDPKAVAMIGLRSFSRQLMDFGLFHADPHPGNTIVMYDGRVSLVDFGIMGYLDEESMMQIANIFLGYAEHDYDMIIGALQDAGIIDEDHMDVESFRIDLKDISEPFYGRSLNTISVRDVYEQVMQTVLKHGIRLPRNYLLLLKTFIQTEALGKILDSDASILEVTRPYAKTLLQQGYNAQRIFKNLGRDTRQFSGYMRLMPKFVHDILRRTAAGKHQLEMRHTGLENLNINFEKGVNRLTVGLVIAASLMAAALVLNAARGVMEMTVTIAGHTLSITTLFGLIGYVIATVLGLWLILSIFRSGKL